MTLDIQLRNVIPDDLPVFFDHQQDAAAIKMAAFTTEDPTNWGAFNDHWTKIMAEPTVVIRTITSNDEVLGYVLSYEEADRPEVSYWIDRRYWGGGIATRALHTFLSEANTRRPIYARVAVDNTASRRVLSKCGFRRIEASRGFANGRGEEIDELLLVLC